MIMIIICHVHVTTMITMINFPCAEYDNADDNDDDLPYADYDNADDNDDYLPYAEYPGSPTPPIYRFCLSLGQSFPMTAGY